MTAARRNITIKQTEAQSQEQNPKIQNKSKHTDKSRKIRHIDNVCKEKTMHRHIATTPS